MLQASDIGVLYGTRVLTGMQSIRPRGPCGDTWLRMTAYQPIVAVEHLLQLPVTPAPSGSTVVKLYTRASTATSPWGESLICFRRGYVVPHHYISHGVDNYHRRQVGYVPAVPTGTYFISPTPHQRSLDGAGRPDAASTAHHAGQPGEPT